MQLLSVLWVSSLWAIILVSFLFHAIYIGQSVACSVQHEEQMAMTQAFMRVACMRYQSDAQVRERVRREKQYSFLCEINHQVFGTLSATIFYRFQPQGIHVALMVRRGKLLVTTAEHLFAHQAFSVAQKV